MSTRLLVACAHCQAINRVPVDKLTAGGKCGSCHELLFAGKVIELTETTFKVHRHKSQIPLLVDFWAAWCGPCKTMAPIFSAAAHELEPLCRLGKVNTETENRLAAEFAIKSIPTLILFRQDGEQRRMSGAMDQQNLLAWVKQNL